MEFDEKYAHIFVTKKVRPYNKYALTFLFRICTHLFRLGSAFLLQRMGLLLKSIMRKFFRRQLFSLLFATYCSFLFFGDRAYAKIFDCGWQPDLYYTYASASCNFLKEDVVNIQTSELALYGKLLRKSFKPTTVLCEVFVSPLPYLAANVREHHGNLYGKFDLAENYNLLSSLTAGEEDPWGVSLFLGKIVPFKPKKKKTGFMGVAYSGYLFTTSKKHFKSNRVYDDDWFQGEWKIKGIRITRFYKQVWSFRAGLKFHDNPFISDTVYLSLYRDRVESFRRRFKFWRNSGFDIYAGFSKKGFIPIKLSFLFRKNFPSKIKARKVVYSFSAGVLWEGVNKYSGYLKDRDKATALQVILRPSLKF